MAKFDYTEFGSSTKCIRSCRIPSILSDPNSQHCKLRDPETRHYALDPVWSALQYLAGPDPVPHDCAFEDPQHWTKISWEEEKENRDRQRSDNITHCIIIWYPYSDGMNFRTRKKTDTNKCPKALSQTKRILNQHIRWKV